MTSNDDGHGNNETVIIKTTIIALVKYDVS
jgi:hypothetical protein